MARHKGGRISLTAFEADWLSKVLGTINPIEIEALAYTNTRPPARVIKDAGAAWDRLVDKIEAVAPEGDGWQDADDHLAAARRMEKSGGFGLAEDFLRRASARTKPKAAPPPSPDLQGRE